MNGEVKVGKVRCECCRRCGPCIIGSGAEEDECMRRQGWTIDGDTCLCPGCAVQTAHALAVVFAAALTGRP
jgi:hypothetical protein